MEHLKIISFAPESNSSEDFTQELRNWNGTITKDDKLFKPKETPKEEILGRLKKDFYYIQAGDSAELYPTAIIDTHVQTSTLEMGATSLTPPKSNRLKTCQCQ